jgi:hypothetical protein
VQPAPRTGPLVLRSAYKPSSASDI